MAANRNNQFSKNTFSVIHPFLLGSSWVIFLVKESACQCRRSGFSPWVKNIPWKRKWQSVLVFLWIEEPGVLQSKGSQRVRHE